MVCSSRPPLGRVRGWAALALSASLPAAALAQPGTVPPLTSVQIASGIPQPTWIGAPRQDENRLFVLEKGINGTANIRVIDLRTNTLQPTPFLTVTGLLGDFECGLLGLVFHPDFANNGYFWIHCTRDNQVQIIRYHVPGDPLTATAADPDSATPVLSTPGHPTIHHGGWMDFAPDGTLFIAIGDGGDGARAITLDGDLSGKILRIDVDGPDNIPGNDDDDGFPEDPERLYTIPANNPFVGIPGDDEIWAYGMRNPWRDDIDPATGDLFFAVVGGDHWEEINFEPATPAGAVPGDPDYYAGRHYGWPCYEGVAPNEPDLCPDPETVFTWPFLVYGHGEAVPPLNITGCSVTGGLVYRGCAIPELQGTYFFSDFCNARIFTLRYDGQTISELTDRTAELDPGPTNDISFPSSFGRDARGEIYVADLLGWEIFKIVPADPADVNHDGVPDGCRCPADFNADGVTNSTDISAYLTAWLAAIQGGPHADYNRDGTTNSTDISAFLTSWLAALGGGC